MTTMKDVAKATGLSLATVSRVFNGSDKVTEKTRKSVLKAAEKLNFRPNKMAAALRSGKSKTVGVVVPIIDNDVFSSAIKSMESHLREAGYHIIICQSHESLAAEVEIIQNLLNLQVDGVIISVSKETTDMAHMDSLKAQGTSIVLFDRKLEFEEVNSVIINNYNGGYQATAHLIEQGCKRIVHLAGKESVSIFKERKRGFENALQDHGLSYSEKDIISFEEDEALGREELIGLLSGNNRPDGIFAHGDISALVAVGVLKELNLRVPEDVAIIGFGDATFCSFLSPPLSSVNQRNEDIGKLAASILLEQLEEKKEGQVFTQSMLPPELIVRESSTKNI
ncbi:MAG: LacI family DNA-binding transcriptional regulator [Bacteroidota bacterium]